MALGIPGREPGDFVRDERADVIAALLREYKSYQSAGMDARALDVADVLKAYGVQVDKAPAGVKERAVSPETVEKAVESDIPPKRRGRPKKETAAE